MFIYGPGTAGDLLIHHHSFKGAVSRDGYSSRDTSPLIVLNALDDDFPLPKFVLTLLLLEENV